MADAAAITDITIIRVPANPAAERNLCVSSAISFLRSLPVCSASRDTMRRLRTACPATISVRRALTAPVPEYATNATQQTTLNCTATIVDVFLATIRMPQLKHA